MKSLQSSIVASSLLAVGLFAGNTASGAEICEWLYRCDNGCYTSVAKRTTLVPGSAQTLEAQCEKVALSAGGNDEYLVYDLPLNVAPGPMALECNGAGGNGYCEGWPQGDSITYSWSATGSIVLDAAVGTANPVRGYSCTPGTHGTITIAAYSPSGASETLTQTVSCQ